MMAEGGAEAVVAEGGPESGWAADRARKQGLRSVAAACLGQASWEAVHPQWVVLWGEEAEQWQGEGEGARAVVADKGRTGG